MEQPGSGGYTADRKKPKTRRRDSVKKRKEKIRAQRRSMSDQEGDEEGHGEYELIEAIEAVAEERLGIDIDCQQLEAYAGKVLTLDLSEKSVYTKLAVGGAAGWFTGYVFAKIGKSVATALGGSLLLIHAGTRAGYITVDWNQINEDANEMNTAIKAKLREQANDPVTKRLMDKGVTFAKKNVAIAGGFGAGFFLGMLS